MTITAMDARDARTGLVLALAGSGALDDPLWREAFAAVPREQFAPAVYRVNEDGQFGTIMQAGEAGYLPAVYSDDAIVTQLSDRGIPTSSSTQPLVMAWMLAALDVREGNRVLEIGTGTGYNAALLCRRLGSRQVVSVDIDPQLVHDARVALEACGYAPILAAGDGLLGYLPCAPYDRIIATCSVRRVPTEWLAQTRPGGVVVVNLSSGAVPLRVLPDGSGVGKFLPHIADFIEARPADGPRNLTVSQILDACMDKDGEHVSTGGAEFAELRGDAFDFFRRLVQPGIDWCALEPEGEYVHCLADPAAGSWARAHEHDGVIEVAEGGPRRLWAEVAKAHRRFVDAGRPSHDRLGLTVTADGGHTLWVDEPAGVRWVLD